MILHVPKYLRFVMLAVLLLGSGLMQAQQSVADLEQDKKRLEEEINYTNKLLEDIRQDKELTLSQLVILGSKISKRENLIATIQKQLLALDRKINQGEQEVGRLQKELSTLRKEYARMVEFAYKNRDSYNKLVFLFSAEDFNQAFQRLKYLQQYAAFRKAQIERIQKTQNDLQAQLATLTAEKKKQTELLDAQRREQIVLSTERAGMDADARKLAQKEQSLRNTIRQKEREARQLQKAIEDIIAEEVRKASASKGEKVPREDRLLELTPEELKLSNSFASNKGKLPWPTERGIISSRFGPQPHPVLKKVTIKNNGIDIATAKGTDARAVFEGVVVSTNKITASNNAVIIRHGEYFTVYSNLETVYVKRGDQVKTKEALGRVHTDKTESKTELHFELWIGRTIVDPALWLAR